MLHSIAMVGSVVGAAFAQDSGEVDADVLVAEIAEDPGGGELRPGGP